MATIPQIVARRGLDMGNAVQIPTGSPVGAALEKAGNRGLELVQRAQERQERAERFDALMGFDALDTSLRRDLEAAQQQAQPGATGLTRNFMETYDKRAKDWLGQQPKHLQPELGARLQAHREKLLWSASGVEVAERRKFEITGIENRATDARNGLLQAGPDMLPDWQRDLEEKIDAGTLTPLEKEEAKRKIRVSLQETAYRGLAQRNPAAARDVAEGWGVGRGLSGDAVERTMALLRNKEGFREGTYWDVNAHRVGYGSDTITDASGNVRRVQQGDRVSRADAERDLRRRTSESLTGIQQTVGADAFSRLNANQQAALASVAYNYGQLPENVAAAVRTGNAEGIASAIESLQGHNNGINRERRRAEAALVRSGGTETHVPGVLTSDTRFNDIPAERRLILANLAEDEERQQLAATAAAQTREYQVKRNDLELRLMDGNATDADIQQARDEGWLTDADHIQKMTNIFAQRTKRLEDETAAAQAIALGSDYIWNPLDKGDKDKADAAFKQLGGDMKALEALADHSGFVPPTAAVALRGGLVSNNPQQVETALQTAANLISARPQVFAGVEGGKELADAALTFRHYVNGRGMAAQAATRKIMEERTPEFERTVSAKIKREDVDKFARTELSENDIRGAFDDSFLGLGGNPQLGFDPKSRQDAMGDYEESAREHFLRTGDKGLAKTLALEDLKRTWGVTNVTGKPTIMKYPPDRAPAYATIPDAGAWIAKQAVEAIKSWNGIDVERRNIRLSQETRATPDRYRAGEPPPYQLSYTDANGHFQLIPVLFVAEPEQMRRDVIEARRGVYEERRAQLAPIFQRRDTSADTRRRLNEEARQRILETRRAVEGSSVAVVPGQVAQ